MNLETNDGIKYFIDNDAIKLSKVLSDTLRFTQDNDTVKLSHVNHETLEKLIIWLDYYKTRNIPEKDMYTNKYNFVLNSWDIQFLNMKDSLLINLVIASDFLDIDFLTHVLMYECGRRLNNRCYYL